MALVTACSHCTSKLKIKSESLIGRKVRCPKCGEAFVVKPLRKPQPQKTSKPVRKKQLPPEDDFLDDFADDFGDDSFEDYEEDLPPTPSPKKKSKKGKKKKKRGNSGGIVKILIIIAAALIGLAGMGAVAMFVFPLLMELLSGGGRMAWLPNDTAMFMEVRVADVWNSAPMAPIRDGQIGAQIKQQIAKSGTTLNLEDIDRVAFGYKPNDKNGIGVMYSKKTIREEFPDLATKESYGGYNIYSQAGRGLFLASSKVLVMGPVPELKKSIDSKGKCAAADSFSSIPMSGDLIIIGRPDAMPKPSVGVSVTANEMEQFMMVMNFDSNIDIQVTGICKDSETATRLSEKQQSGFDEAKKNTPPNLPGGLSATVKQIVESVQFAQSGTHATMSLSIPGSTIKQLVDQFGSMMPSMIPSFPGGPVSPSTPPSVPSGP